MTPDYVDLVFREGGRLRLSGSIVERFGLELEGELAEKLEQAQMQLEEMVKQRDEAEGRLYSATKKLVAVETLAANLGSQCEALKVELRRRDERYEARCEEIKKAYRAMKMLILQRLRAALKEADQEVSHAPLT